MKISEELQIQISNLNNVALQRYLFKKCWKIEFFKTNDMKKDIILYQRHDYMQKLHVPIVHNFSYDKLMIAVVKELSIYEKRNITDILNDINNN